MRSKLLFVLFAGLLVCACGSSESGNLEYADVDQKDPSGKFHGDADDYFANAQKYYGAGDYHRALDQFGKQLKIAPDDRPGQLGQAFSHYQVGLGLAQRGRLLDAAESMKRAESGFTKIWNGKLVKDTTIEDDFNWKSCMGLAMTERAIAALEKKKIDMIDRRLNGISDQGKSAKARTQQKRHEEQRMHYLRRSFEKFQRLSQMQNTAPEVLLNLGDIQLIRGNESAAERAYLDYLAIARHSVEVWNKRRQEAIETYKSKNERNRVLAIMKRKEESATKKTVDVLVHLAEIKFSRQNWGDSLSYLKDAIGLDPERQSLNVPIAECYDKLGDYDQALVHIGRYIQASPSFDKDTQRAFQLRSELLKKRGDTSTNGRLSK